jgi:polysaccharide export outer membrane protein
MFEVTPEQVEKQTATAEVNYRIRKNDLLTLQVYTNQGERIVDPNPGSFSTESSGAENVNIPRYLVDVNGLVKFPLIDALNIEGLTIRQAEEILQKTYEKFYQQPFVVLEFLNKRVVVLGAPGGQVVPLANENMRLTEVLALAKGITPEARVNNIRVIRADKIFIADLSNFQNFEANNMIMQPGDVIYIEPVRRPFVEGLRDYSPMISIVTSLATLAFIIIQTNK